MQAKRFHHFNQVAMVRWFGGEPVRAQLTRLLYFLVDTATSDYRDPKALQPRSFSNPRQNI